MTNFQKSTPNPSFDKRRGTSLGLKLDLVYLVGKSDRWEMGFLERDF